MKQTLGFGMGGRAARPDAIKTWAYIHRTPAAVRAVHGADS